ncbi:hypothetical protein B1T44_24580 [Mycobacterium persicum]|nr:hypothetical protein B1T44_24580 [Mycobacterium persicum]
MTRRQQWQRRERGTDNARWFGSGGIAGSGGQAEVTTGSAKPPQVPAGTGVPRMPGTAGDGGAGGSGGIGGWGVRSGRDRSNLRGQLRRAVPSSATRHLGRPRSKLTP